MSDKPYINAHFKGADRTSVEIDMIYVPPSMRGQGLGRKLYEDFEAKLPPETEIVTPFAADTGDGRSNDFWERLGFDYRYTAGSEESLAEALGHDTEAMYTMWKGVNGHPTPPTEWVLPEEDEEDEQSWNP